MASDHRGRALHAGKRTMQEYQQKLLKSYMQNSTPLPVNPAKYSNSTEMPDIDNAQLEN